MNRRQRLLCCSITFGVLALAAVPAASFAEGGSHVACAGATVTTTTATGTTTTTIAEGSSPPSGGSCWEDVQPYPFGSNGVAVNPSECAPHNAPGSPQVAECYLTVTSMAFRAWNRGLAATEANRGEPTPYPVWIFNGTTWYPAPLGLPRGPSGERVCRGNTIVWAGKLDYWLVGGEPGGSGKWADLCRFDGAHLEWDPLEVPEATLDRVTPAPTAENPHPAPAAGTVTSAACFTWNNCWFFGTYGTVVHWNGEVLTDASPPLHPLLTGEQSLLGEYTGAVARQNPAGEPFGVAVSGTSERSDLKPLQTLADGASPAQLYASSGQTFSPLAFTPITEPPFTTPQSEDPYRTDLVAVDFDSAGQGWVAGNPAGLRTGTAPSPHDPSPPGNRAFSSPSPQPSPLLPVSASGGTSVCEGPPGERFTYTAVPAATAAAGAFLWSSIAVFPFSGEALAGGRMRRAVVGEGPNEDASVGEPVIVRAGCDKSTSATRFHIPDPTHPGFTAPADREDGVTAVVANAANDAWAATGEGGLTAAAGQSGYDEPPQLYRLSNDRPPEAPEGNDNESRPLPEPEPPTYVIEPPPPEPSAPPPVTVSQARRVTLPAAVYDVKARLHTTKIHGRTYLSLYLTFKLRRPVTVGAQALRNGRVVSAARPRRFSGRAGLLILKLDPKHWPTKVHFIT